MTKKIDVFINKLKQEPLKEAIRLFFIYEIKHNTNLKKDSIKVYKTLFFKELKKNFNQKIIDDLKNELKG